MNNTNLNWKKIKYCLTLLTLTMALQMASPVVTSAQCPMCRMSAESNLKAGGSAGKGLNKGILFLLMMPYFVVGGIGYVWYKNRKMEQEL